MTPTEKHMDAARAFVREHFNTSKIMDPEAYAERIAKAMTIGEREGMKRAAEIALSQLFAKHPEKGRTTSQEKLYSRDRAMCRRISRAILSETGEG